MRRYLAYAVFMVVVAATATAEELQDQVEARAECSENFFSQPEVRDCLARKATASASELRKVEGKLRQNLAKWDESPTFVREAIAKLDSSNEEFERFRTSHCAFISSVAGGAAGNSREIMLLGCVFELNSLRIMQLGRAMPE